MTKLLAGFGIAYVLSHGKLCDSPVSMQSIVYILQSVDSQHRVIVKSMSSQYSQARAKLVRTAGFELVVGCWWNFVWKKVHVVHGTLLGFSFEAYRVKNVKIFARLAVPLMVTTTVVGSSESVVVLASAQLGTRAVAALAVLKALKDLAKAGFKAGAIQVRMSSLIVKQPGLARRLFWGALFGMVGLSSMVALLLYGAKWRVARSYSHDTDVIDLVVDNLPLMLICFVIGVATDCLKNGMIGMSSNDEMASAQLVASWLVHVPLSLHWMSNSEPAQGIVGNLWGCMIGEIVRMSMMVYFMTNTNWEKQSLVVRAQSS